MTFAPGAFRQPAENYPPPALCWPHALETQLRVSAARQQIRFCTAEDGVKIAYAVAGRGPAVVKAANWLSHLEYDWKSPVWRPWLDEICRDHTLVRYDERGCGLSDWDAVLSFDAWVRDLETVVNAAGLERFPLLGYSQGAPIAIAYAVRYPERVTHLVLHGSYARGFLKRNPSPKQREEAATMAKLIELGWGKENPAFRQFFTTQFIPGGTPEQHDWFNELERVSTSPEIALRFFHVLNEIDVTALAPQVRCPALVSHSRQDARVPFDEGRLVASLIPGARFLPIESRNHILLGTEPGWRLWFDEVRAFLAPASAGGDAGAFAQLTARERELAECIAQGLDNAQIAARLELSEKTVRNHITSIFAKLGVENRSQLIVRALGAKRG
jgi:pimeloyl-ACP methyl ester carboxylesterase/DNA-binding CsgD family transcriptional regulator